MAVGLYGVLDAGAPRALGLPLLGVGSVALAAGLFAGGRRAVRTRYRPDPWRLAEWVVALSGLAALAGMIVAARLPGGAAGARTRSAYPLAWPTLPLAAVAGIVVGPAARRWRLPARPRSCGRPPPRPPPGRPDGSGPGGARRPDRAGVDAAPDAVAA